MNAAPARFPRLLRVTRPQDFDRVFQTGSRAASRELLVVACGNELEYSRFGVSTGRKFGSSPRRNRARRLLREAFRLNRADFPVGFDFIAVPRAPAFPDSLEAAAERLLRQACRATEQIRRTR
ncbi:MAG: ribonuclease P protein component [Planctomycetota bacterium]